MKIVCDQDDSMWQTNQLFLIWHNKKYRTSFKLSQIKEFNMGPIFGISHDAMADRFQEFYLDPMFAKLKFFKHSRSIMKSWNKRGELIFNATSKPDLEKIVRVVNEILEREIPNVVQEVLYLGRHCMEKSHGNKVEACRSVQADLFIDDHIENVVAVARELRIPSVLINRPWNDHFDPTDHPLVARAFNWLDVNTIYFAVSNGKDFRINDQGPLWSRL